MDKKVLGRIKTKPEDFIVEEKGPNWTCSVSLDKESTLTSEIETLSKQEPKDFIWCELQKKDIDHFQAIKEVARLLDKNVRDIGYAGTKDRLAVTSQRISIYHPDLDTLKKFDHERILLKNLQWAKRKIRLGYLEENHFHITVRDVDKKGAMKITNEITKKTYFPNYFGAQRFGSLRNNNVEIGTLLLKRKFEEAIWKLLTDISKKERPDVQHARKRLQTEKNFKEASNYFPNFLRLEKQLLRHLARKPKDFINALKYAERKNLLMFVHAVQSKLFNEILQTALDEGLDFTKKGHENCILPGYKTKFYDGRLGEIEQEILNKYNIQLSDFDIRELSFLRIKGSYRKALTHVKDLQVEISDDEEFSSSKKITLSFTLPSGVYATTYLENFFEMQGNPR